VKESALLRVESALQLLPDLETLAPLRALVLSIARADEQMQWASAGPYLTVGKRGVDPAELRRRMPELLESISQHVGFLFGAYADALEAKERGDGAEAVAALLAAGQREEAGGRQLQARAWYEAARPIAAALQSRRPESVCLQRLGGVYLDLGHYDEAARCFQRDLAIAEAEFDQGAAIAASLGLGDTALARGEWSGAKAWYQRAHRLAEAVGDAASTARVQRQLGILAHRRGDLTAAGDHLRRAREGFEALGEAMELGRVLNAQGQVEAALRRQSAAGAAFREALAWSHRAPNDAPLEIAIRLNIAELALETDRLLAAEEDLRRAEEVAIAGNLPGLLVGIYTLMGKLRGLQHDETGFVFFEQAIELCRTLGRPQAEQARVYHEYGSFRGRLGQGTEARAYLEQARDLFEALGRTIEVARVTEEIEQLSA
jgi:tetratricopeptide (TPR) repeat protein